ncbi:MAG: hypothetical protein LBJ02_06685 [Bifidobacteriaceae bacterium]|jgi:tRNA/tmRNA/rRNA uracil-C5-methylase (TrmA/RlmC/RlmD family)|nr:hypothetical protein [Bifidobacteriaceae bacterium]
MIELTAGPWGNGGICACRQDDAPVVLLAGAIPGERVRAEVTATNKSYWRARAVEVLEPSPDRVDPPWPDGQLVGAANWGHLAPPAALVAKAEVVGGLLRHGIGHHPQVEVEPVGDGAQLGWRTRIELGVDAEGRAGMFAAGTHRIEPLESMPMAVPAIEALGLFGRRWTPATRLTAVAPSAGKAFWMDDAARRVRRRAEVVRVAGQEFHYELAAGGFWQIHHQAPRTLVEAVLAGLRPAHGEEIWDLYAGAGLFTLPLAAAGARVSAVEGSRRAAHDLRVNAKRAGLDLAGATAAPVARALRSGLDGGGPDAVLLDPPRAGAGRAVIELIKAAGPARIAYLACEPSALVRDLAILLTGSYRLTALRAFDLFPGTHHVEVLALAESV